MRILNYLAFLPLASRVPVYGRLVLALLRDPRVPAWRKAILAGAAGYVAAPFDLVPDDLPIVGALDDAVVLLLAVELFLDGLPRDVLTETLEALEIDAAAFDRDRAQVRRLIPRPIRHVAMRLPHTARAAGSLARQLGVDRRLRSWLTMEVPLA